MTFENTVLHEFRANPTFTPRRAPDMRGNCRCIGYSVCVASTVRLLGLSYCQQAFATKRSVLQESLLVGYFIILVQPVDSGERCLHKMFSRLVSFFFFFVQTLFIVLSRFVCRSPINSSTIFTRVLVCATRLQRFTFQLAFMRRLARVYVISFCRASLSSLRASSECVLIHSANVR